MTNADIEVKGKTLNLETGRFAKQADGSIVATFGDTVVLATAVAKKEVRENIDFFPLTIDYQEKAYAAGKIPGGFFKREGRPTEKEVLTSRLIDRPVRPLFPDGYMCETQVIATVLSADQQNNRIDSPHGYIQLLGCNMKGILVRISVDSVDDEKSSKKQKAKK